MTDVSHESLDMACYLVTRAIGVPERRNGFDIGTVTHAIQPSRQTLFREAIRAVMLTAIDLHRDSIRAEVAEEERQKLLRRLLQS